MRVLVTGSRDWNADAAVWIALDDLYVRNGFLTVVHGAARGADTIAAQWAQSKPGVAEEPHPADWFQHGKSAGFIRNKEMVELLTPGQDIVLAFQRNRSRGTQHTIDLAKARGLEISIWRAE